MPAKFEKGRYRIEIIGQTLTKNKNNNPEFQINFKFLGYYDANKELVESTCDDANRTVFLVLTPQTIGTPQSPGWVLSLLRELGFEGTSFAQLSLDHEDAFSLVGKQLDANCDLDMYQNKLREKWYLQTGKGRPLAQPMNKQDLKSLSGLDSVLKGSATAKKADKPKGPGKKADKVPF